jgi:hypothetical protein
MQAYNLDQLPINLNGWMNSRFLKPILNIEGGWEYWMQIDFPAWLDTSTGLQWDFRREVVENNVRLDWAVNTNSMAPRTAINLKCQTPKYLKSRFLSDVADDVTKLRSVGSTYATKLMIAATVDGDTRDQLVTNGFNSLYKYETLVEFMFLNC